MEKVIYKQAGEDPSLALVPETTLSEEISNDQMDAAMPKPVGHKLLLALPEVEKTYGGGIVKARQTIDNEQITSVVAVVLDMGPDAYADATRFPTGPWCKVGDYVLIGPYAGKRFSVFGKEFRVINDDTIEAVVPDPTGYRRI